MTTPFAVVTFFEADQTLSFDESLDCTTLKQRIDDSLPTLNIPYAVKVEGAFESIKTRSVPRQSEPYPPLADVVAEETIFELSAINGVMAGFRLPSYVDRANVVGYHFHFVSNARDKGGHVLDCQSRAVTVGIDYSGEWKVALPKGQPFYNADLSPDE